MALEGFSPIQRCRAAAAPVRSGTFQLQGNDLRSSDISTGYLSVFLSHRQVKRREAGHSRAERHQQLLVAKTPERTLSPEEGDEEGDSWKVISAAKLLVC